MRKVMVPLLIFSTSTALLLGKGKKKESLDTPFQQWDRAQVVEVFNNSPWAQAQTYSSELGQGNIGENELHYNFSLRLFSALPIRQAYVRMLEIMNHYDSLAPEKQREFDSKVDGILHADVRDEVVVAVAYTTDDPEGSRNIRQFFDTSTTATLNQNAYLYSPEAGRVDLKEYVPPGEGGIGARFIYPRTVKGKPLLQPGDKQMRFEMYVPPINQRVLAGFDGRKMEYQGKLEY